MQDHTQQQHLNTFGQLCSLNLTKPEHMRATCPIAWPVIWLHLNNSRDLQQTARSTQHLRLGTRMQPCVRAEPTVTRLGESRQQPEMNKETQTRWDGLSTSHLCMMLAAAQCYIVKCSMHACKSGISHARAVLLLNTAICQQL